MGGLAWVATSFSHTKTVGDLPSFWQWVIYPLVNEQLANWKSTIFKNGKQTNQMAVFNSYVTNYQRVNPIKHPIKSPLKLPLTSHFRNIVKH